MPGRKRFWRSPKLVRRLPSTGFLQKRYPNLYQKTVLARGATLDPGRVLDVGREKETFTSSMLTRIHLRLLLMMISTLYCFLLIWHSGKRSMLPTRGFFRRMER